MGQGRLHGYLDLGSCSPLVLRWSEGVLVVRAAYWVCAGEALSTQPDGAGTCECDGEQHEGHARARGARAEVRVVLSCRRAALTWRP